MLFASLQVIDNTYSPATISVKAASDCAKKRPASGPFPVSQIERQSRLMNSRNTYQNISAIDANNASEAATYLSVG
jgi:uncharacterized protein (DUF39 family)